MQGARAKLLYRYLFLLAVFGLSGCVNMATTGAQAIYNRHSLQKNFNDQYTSMKVHQALTYKTDHFRDANISIATLNGEVLLTGQAPAHWQREEAGKIAQGIPEVQKVYNLITVSSPSSAMTRMSDAWLTTKIKSKLMASNDVDVTQIKVVTENGTVYLMGTVKGEEAQAAVDIARTTDGVQSVVKIFSYIKISKTLT